MRATAHLVYNDMNGEVRYMDEFCILAISLYFAVGEVGKNSMAGTSRHDLRNDGMFCQPRYGSFRSALLFIIIF